MTNKKHGKIVYRKIRGRIVPIKVKEAVGISAGVGVGALAGHYASNALRRSAQAERISRDLFSRVSKLPQPLTRVTKIAKNVATRMAKVEGGKAIRLFATKNVLLAGGAALGSKIIYESLAGKSKKSKDQALKFSIAAPLAAATTYYYPLNRKILPTLKYAIKKTVSLIK